MSSQSTIPTPGNPAPSSSVELLRIRQREPEESRQRVEEEAPGMGSPRRQQLHRQNLSDVTILELWSLLRAYNFQGKNWRVNCGYFCQVWLYTVATTYPPTLSQCQAAVHAVCTQNVRELRWAKRTLSSRYQGCISGCWLLLWSQRGKQVTILLNLLILLKSRTFKNNHIYVES